MTNIEMAQFIAALKTTTDTLTRSTDASLTSMREELNKAFESQKRNLRKDTQDAINHVWRHATALIATHQGIDPTEVLKRLSQAIEDELTGEDFARALVGD